MDYFDIINENSQPAGYTRTRIEAHEQGLWHRTVHIWAVNKKNEVLLQKRAPNLVSHPGKWDISVGGHINAGETSLEAVIREVKEELGLVIKSNDLRFLFNLKQCSVQNNNTFINNEFNDIYLFEREIQINEVNLAPDEITDVNYMPANEVLKLMKQNDKSIVDHKEELEKVIAYIK